MIIWIDAQLSPLLLHGSTSAIRIFRQNQCDLSTFSEQMTLPYLMRQKHAEAVIMSKDSDFLKLVDQFGTPPQIIWITCGNTSNNRMRAVLEKSLEKAVELIRSGEPIVEIGDKA